MTFYEKVKQELARPRIDGLCNNSKTFKENYSVAQKRLKIINHANAFHEQHLRNETFRVDARCINYYEGYFLFHTIGFENFLQVRLEFIEWCIENKLDL